MIRSRVSLAILSLAAVGLAGGALAARFLASPRAATTPGPDPAAGRRFQDRMAQILLRQAGLSRRHDPVVVTSAEVNAFLSRHVEVRGVPLWPVIVRLEQGRLEVAGRTSLRRLVAGRSIEWLDRAIPRSLMDVGLWLVVAGRVEVDRGLGRLVVERVAVGSQAIPEVWLWRLLRTTPSDVLAWRMPPIIEQIDLEPDRLVIHTRWAPG